MSQTKTINLTGAETRVDFDRPFAYVECNNLSGAEVLLSTKPNIDKGADDVIIIKAESTATIGDLGTPKIKTVYLNGNGEIQLVGKGYAESSFKTARKGGESNGKILLNLPLTNDLSDISGFNRVVTYTGDTPLTITPDDGIFLYKGRLRLKDAAFLADIPKFTIEFDMKLGKAGVNSSNAYAREFAQIYGESEELWYGIGCTVSYRNSSNPAPLSMYASGNTTNKRSFEYTLNSYDDGKYHHIVLHYDNTSNFVYITTDDSDPIVMWFSKNVVGSIIWGRNDSYGLNGYIKNIIIKN